MQHTNELASVHAIVTHWMSDVDIVTELDFLNVLSRAATLHFEHNPYDAFDLAKCMLEFSIMDAKFVNYKKSTLAVSSLIISLQSFGFSNKINGLLALELDNLETISECVEHLVDCFSRIDNETNLRNSIRRQYSPAVSDRKLRDF
eukprot:CAMPEP_0117020412 /NCGR_PEP_ID=MMETSP0472-20121206/15526_1 /TAXON_ID=693140 ORGANISM="Tiarina fusus, Strain LIS" /NCGR_SAMPLE_ID=MMETSP0472 /ASSEMBLY_ACC=CAM_ASM_000603 /LENGTH=145 /DNA_ID=CAMNT_0004725623 /DNA_START=285 /DNA_END=719 /DNA_ORIENTATION=-